MGLHAKFESGKISWPGRLIAGIGGIMMPSSSSSSSFRGRVSLEELEHRLDHLDHDVKEIKDIVSARRPRLRDWGIGAAVVSVTAALLATFLVGYFHTLDDRDTLRHNVDNLQQEVSNLGAMRDLVSQYNALITYALQQNKLSEQEVSRFVRGTPGLAPAGQQLRTAQITDPSERAQVVDGTIVRGVISSFKFSGATIVSNTCWTAGCSKNLSSSEKTIWIVTQDVATNRFYPQGSWTDQAGPVLINSAGEWVSPAVSMGGTSRGAPIFIDAILVSHKGEDVFKEYLKEGAVTGHYVGLKFGELPAGADILDTVMVFRR